MNVSSLDLIVSGLYVSGKKWEKPKSMSCNDWRVTLKWFGPNRCKLLAFVGKEQNIRPLKPEQGYDVTSCFKGRYTNYAKRGGRKHASLRFKYGEPGHGLVYKNQQTKRNCGMGFVRTLSGFCCLSQQLAYLVLCYDPDS